MTADLGGVGETDGILEDRIAARSGGVRISWWAKAWQSAVEEACYSSTDLAKGLKMARAGKVGQIRWGHNAEGGWFLAGVEDGDDVYTARARVSSLPPEQRTALREVVASEAGRVGALLLGNLPQSLVADAEELGVELLPWSGDLSFTCSCEPWADPCPHAVAMAVQVGWLMHAEVDVLFSLRGVSIDSLVHAHNELRRPPQEAAEPEEWRVDLDVAVEAAERAARLLED